MQGYSKNRSGIIDIGTVPAGVPCFAAVFLLYSSYLPSFTAVFLLCSSLFALHL